MIWIQFHLRAQESEFRISDFQEHSGRVKERPIDIIVKDNLEQQNDLILNKRGEGVTSSFSMLSAFCFRCKIGASIFANKY